jgi:hypothetical protein
MSNFKFELNSQGVRDLLKSNEMAEICNGYASKALGALGSGYSSNMYYGKNRVNVEVYAETFQAKRDNLKNNSILKAVHG